MPNKKIIVQISEGLGNQLFMYAHAYALSKKLNYYLHIDNLTAYRRKKNLLRIHQKYMLHYFNIENSLIHNDLFINYFFSNFLRKILLFVDKFRFKKNFFIEFKEKKMVLRLLINHLI